MVLVVFSRPSAADATASEPIAEPLVVELPIAEPIAEPLHAWVQTPDRDARADGERAALPARQPSPFLAPASA